MTQLEKAREEIRKRSETRDIVFYPNVTYKHQVNVYCEECNNTGIRYRPSGIAYPCYNCTDPE